MNQLEKKVLKKFGEALVLRKSELIKFIKDDVKNPENPKTVLDSIIQKLIQQKYITPLYASESTFAITQNGMKELQ